MGIKAVLTTQCRPGLSVPQPSCLWLSSAEVDVPSSGNKEKNTLAAVTQLDVLNKNHLRAFNFHFLCIKYNQIFYFSEEIMLVSYSTRNC